MKLVTFSEPVAPHGVGDTRLVPDALAEELREAGKISSIEPWPASDAAAPSAAAARRPRRAFVNPERPAGQLDLRIAR